ncbi:MAG: hypothetical protein Q4G47_01295 [Lachnospiraceae bacterium]|nr:hypothetical protein [Lachnospiraceae bacterium]
MGTAEKSRKMVMNTAYTIAGALVLNGVLQLLVYPGIMRKLGADGNGAVLFIMAFVNILGPSIGQALNNSRLVLRRDMEVSNGDYNTLIIAFSAVGIAGSLIMSARSQSGPAGFILMALLILLTNFRYYGDVEYRLRLDYRRYFCYYALCAAGYAAGYLVFRAGGSWYLIFIAGEAAALIYVWMRGSIFRPFTGRSKYFHIVVKRGSLLVLSYFITNLTLNIDRLYLKGTLGGEAVTKYYVASLIGKTLVLFVAPVNTVLISYMTRDSERLTKKSFLRYAAAGVAAGALFFVFCQLASPVFIKLFYPSLLDSVKGILPVVNLTQILAMLSAYLFIIVLTFTGPQWQLGLQTGHLVLVVVLITAMTGAGGLAGFSNGVLAANAVRVAAVLVLGFVYAG